MKISILSLTSILLAIIAGSLAYNEISDWGWFLFAAVIFGHISGIYKERQDENI